MKPKVRCFRKDNDGGKLRHGLWIMTGPHRGVFFHGDRNEAQSPRYNVNDLEAWTKPSPDWFTTVEISPFEAIRILENWPEAQQDVRAIFDRHATEVAEQVLA